MSLRIDLSGKRALITGAAAGIGRACATALAEAGASIVAVDVNEQGIQQTIGAIGSGLHQHRRCLVVVLLELLVPPVARKVEVRPVGAIEPAEPPRQELTAPDPDRAVG